MDVYDNVVSFIRFSGIDKTHKPFTRVELSKFINDKSSIDIETDEYSIKIYDSVSKKSDLKSIEILVESSKKKLILIKKTWKHVKLGATFMTFQDFALDIAPVYEKYKPSIISADQLAFHKVNPTNIPKLKSNDILAKWLMAKPGDVVIYYIYMNKEICDMRVVTDDNE